MKLTSPLIADDLRAAYPRDTRGMADDELEIALEDLEAALRSQFGVSRTDTESSDALARAMRRAWPSFLQQTRQVAQETTGADQHSVTYNRAGVIDFIFPAFVGALLAGVSDYTAPAVTQLVR